MLINELDGFEWKMTYSEQMSEFELEVIERERNSKRKFYLSVICSMAM